MAHTPVAEHSAPLATTTGLDHRKMLMWVFLASECLFFGALISTYLIYRGKSLVGPYPQRREVYLERSPIRFIDRLSCPLILFQGLEDQIVPPDQAESMYRAVKAKGIATAYLPFEGEQHGFRQAANIKRALDAELYFYSQVFGFTLADPVEPVAIDNI
mgnify:CR=1 FL=1